MSWRDQTIACRVRGELRVLDGGVPVRVVFQDLKALEVPARLTIQTRLVASDTAADRAIISEIMGDDDSLGSFRLCERLIELSRPAVRRIVETLDAEKSPGTDSIKSVRQAIAGAAFSCGFILTDPFVLDLLARKIAPGFTAKPTPPTAPTATLTMVGGSVLARIDAASGRELHRVTLDTSIGPARSITTTRNNNPFSRDGKAERFLVGAKSGFAIVNDQGSNVIASFADGHSINSIVWLDESSFITTSNDGLTGWKGNLPTRLDALPAKCARAVGEHVVFASGATLRVLEPGGAIDTIGGGAEIIQIFVEDESCLVARADGMIERIDVIEGRVLDVHHLGPYRSIAQTYDFSTGHFALLRADGSIELRSIDSPITNRLRGFTGCRAVSARDGWLIGVSEDSTKLPIWRVEAPHDPVRVIEATHVIGHRAADVVIA